MVYNTLRKAEVNSCASLVRLRPLLNSKPKPKPKLEPKLCVTRNLCSAWFLVVSCGTNIDSVEGLVLVNLPFS